MDDMADEARKAMDRDLGPMPDVDRVRAALLALYEEVMPEILNDDDGPDRKFLTLAHGLVRMKRILDEDGFD